MLASTKVKLIQLFSELGAIQSQITELKDEERAAWESSDDADPDTWETLEEFEDILSGLPAMFDEPDES